ncbi:MAG: hypothetical protein A4E69_00062 [Syntrophus sp. PtaB.Bin138]|nr:MAG: hypothetical protein A4E69_00062 [Syntrophus sp. PtaB.Bin138]
MADDNGAAGEIFQGFLQGAHGIDVQVIGGLVEQEDIGPLLQHPRQVNAVPLPAGEVPHLFLLVRSREVEAGHVGPGVHLAASQGKGVQSLGNRLPDRPVRIEDIPALVHIGQ